MIGAPRSDSTVFDPAFDMSSGRRELVEVKSPTRHSRFGDGALPGMRSLLRFTTQWMQGGGKVVKPTTSD
jgi:hypothetical protein